VYIKENIICFGDDILAERRRKTFHARLKAVAEKWWGRFVQSFAFALLAVGGWCAAENIIRSLN
jgi:hypothetical protein